MKVLEMVENYINFLRIQTHEESLNEHLYKIFIYTFTLTVFLQSNGRTCGKDF